MICAGPAYGPCGGPDGLGRAEARSGDEAAGEAAVYGRGSGGEGSGWPLLLQSGATIVTMVNTNNRIVPQTSMTIGRIIGRRRVDCHTNWPTAWRHAFLIAAQSVT